MQSSEGFFCAEQGLWTNATEPEKRQESFCLSHKNKRIFY